MKARERGRVPRVGLRPGLLLGVVLAGLSAGTADADRAADAGEALAFVRVFGDVRIDVADDWEGPAVLEDRELGTGTAFVIAPAGLLLTNHHVVGGGREIREVHGSTVEVTLEVKRVEVELPNNGGHESYEASVVASDEELDLAVLQVTAGDLPYLPLGDSTVVPPGAPVTVLGFPFGRTLDVAKNEGSESVPSPTVTRGALSAARADEEGVTRFLQTDATVHPGSSGGPILDEDGYVIGVVEMKLVHPEDPDGPAFGVPVTLAKGFLGAAGVLFQVPGTPLGDGVVHDLDWKGLRVRLPEGAVDESDERLRVETGSSGGPVSFLAERVVTAVSPGGLEQALLRGRVLAGFAPGTWSRPRRLQVPGGRVGGWAQGTDAEGRRLRLEYTLVEVGAGNETILARFLGPEEEMAFNLGLVRGALATLEATALLTDPVRGRLETGFEAATLADAEGLVLPAGWTREPETRAACGLIPPATTGVAARPAGDFTVTLRALLWSGGGIDPERVASACGRPEGTPASAFARRQRRLGVDTGLWGAFRRWGEDVVLLEVEAPQSKLPYVRDLYVEWLQRVAP